MNLIEKLVYDAVKPAIAKLDAATRKDVYVFTLEISYTYGDYRQPTVSLGYNTNAQVVLSEKKALSLRDARWNYSFWLHNKLATIGAGKDALILTNWIKQTKLFYTDMEEERNFDDCQEKAEQITINFVEALVGVVKQLHADGIELPIIIHNLEYFEESKVWNIAANGEALVAEFIDWMDSDEF